jgi:hypothetical protein
MWRSSAFLRGNRVHGAPDSLDLCAPAVSALHVGRRFGHWSDDLERLLTVAANELIDRHGQPPNATEMLRGGYVRVSSSCDVLDLRGRGQQQLSNVRWLRSIHFKRRRSPQPAGRLSAVNNSHAHAMGIELTSTRRSLASPDCPPGSGRDHGRRVGHRCRRCHLAKRRESRQ